MNQFIKGVLANTPPGSEIGFEIRDSNEREYLADSMPPDNKIVQKYHSTVWAKYDVDAALELFLKFLSLTATTPDPTVLQALWETGVMSYIRPFTQGEGRGKRFQQDEVFKGLLGPYREDHEKLMTLRNKHLAHAGTIGLHQVLTLLLRHPDWPKTQGLLYTWQTHSALPHPRWVTKVAEMAKLVSGRFHEMQTEVEALVYKELCIEPRAITGPVSLTVKIDTPGDVLPPDQPLPQFRPY